MVGLFASCGIACWAHDWFLNLLSFLPSTWNKVKSSNKSAFPASTPHQKCLLELLRLIILILLKLGSHLGIFPRSAEETTAATWACRKSWPYQLYGCESKTTVGCLGVHFSNYVVNGFDPQPSDVSKSREPRHESTGKTGQTTNNTVQHQFLVDVDVLES